MDVQHEVYGYRSRILQVMNFVDVGHEFCGCRSRMNFVGVGHEFSVCRSRILCMQIMDSVYADHELRVCRT